jgi:hypothetical protein
VTEHTRSDNKVRELATMFVPWQQWTETSVWLDDVGILKVRHFNDIDDISINTTAALKAIPQNQFQNCFEGWTRRWHRCILIQGEYFEGDHNDIQQ